MTTTEQLRVQVRQEVADHLEDADRLVCFYIDQYVDALLHNRRARPRPTGLHPKVAELVREVALDAVASGRFSR